MAMTRDEFDALVRRLEEISHRHPRLYLARTVALLTLAYGYLGFVLLGSSALVVGTIFFVFMVPNALVIKLAIVIVIAAGGICWAVMRGLWVRLEPPEGQPVTREQVPALFTLLDELRETLNCRPFHRVLLVSEYNAAVVQIPRLGVFGWHRNYLLLGLPLMQALGPEEFKAVLAHEFAHSSRGHGRFGNWLYRMRRSWERIFEQMGRQGTRGGVVLLKFIQWFWPHFNAHAFVLARANEYEADACSVRLAGADAAAAALLRIATDDALLNKKFWPEIFARVNRQKDPPSDMLMAMGRTLRAGLPAEEASRSLRHAFLMETNTADTHPCLKDRLQAMGRLPEGVDRAEFPVELPPPPTRSAAEVFLGHHVDTIADQLSTVWRKNVAALWAERHEHMQKLAGELALLEQPGNKPLGVEELWEKASKVLQLHNDAAAVPVLEQLLTLNPEHALANLVRGRHYLEQEDARGVAFVETAIASDPILTEVGCNLLYGYFMRIGQRDKLRPLEELVDRFQNESALAEQERALISAKDDFIPHELTSAQITDLVKSLAVEPEIATAAVARKMVRYFPKNPCYVIALRLKVSWWKIRSSNANQQLMNRVLQRVQLPGHFFVFVDEKDLKSLAKKVFPVPGAVFYNRKQEGKSIEPNLENQACSR